MTLTTPISGTIQEKFSSECQGEAMFQISWRSVQNLGHNLGRSRRVSETGGMDGYRTVTGRTSEFIFCPMRYIALDRKLSKLVLKLLTELELTTNDGMLLHLEKPNTNNCQSATAVTIKSRQKELKPSTNNLE